MKKNVFGFLVDVRKLAVVAILVAVALAIRTLATIDVSPMLKIDIGAVAIIFAIGVLFGPIAGAFAGFAVDILNILIKPIGPYNPFITIGFICYGLIAGILFFRKSRDINTKNIFLIDTVVFIAYLVGFAVITLGIAWAISTNPDPAKAMVYSDALKVVFIGRLPSFLHVIWYLVLTPTLVSVGQKLMTNWEK